MPKGSMNSGVICNCDTVWQAGMTTFYDVTTLILDLDAAFVDMLSLKRQKFPGTKSGFQSHR